VARSRLHPQAIQGESNFVVWVTTCHLPYDVNRLGLRAAAMLSSLQRIIKGRPLFRYGLKVSQKL
jgi:hypothetical protein